MSKKNCKILWYVPGSDVVHTIPVGARVGFIEDEDKPTDFFEVFFDEEGCVTYKFLSSSSEDGDSRNVKPMNNRIGSGSTKSRKRGVPVR